MEARQKKIGRIAAGSVIGIVAGISGFYFAESGTQGMGMLMFWGVPMLAGFAIGFAMRTLQAAAIAASISLLATLTILIALGKEGPLCAFMALFLLAGMVGLGAFLGAWVRSLIKPGRSQNTTIGIFVLLTPVLLVTGKKIEKPLLEKPRIETVSDTVWVPDTVGDVWTDIQSIDSIHSSRPWLMHVGLPIPLRCTLEKPGMGAKRTCYFDKGYIEETVTEWNPPYTLGLVIDRTHMPGRHWLGFENAAYHLQPSGRGTQLTRTTVISSHLRPAWYWRPLERFGVSSEHQYILQDVVIRAEQRAGSKAARN